MSISVGCGNCLSDITPPSASAPANQPIPPINRTPTTLSTFSSMRHITPNGSTTTQSSSSAGGGGGGGCVQQTTSSGTSLAYPISFPTSTSSTATTVSCDGITFSAVPILPCSTFQIKPEANTSPPPPIRSLSVHSLPRTLTCSSYGPLNCASTTTVDSTCVLVEKQELCDDDSSLLVSDSFEPHHPELFPTNYSSLLSQYNLSTTPSLHMFSHSSLLVPLRSSDITDPSLLPLPPTPGLNTQPCAAGRSPSHQSTLTSSSTQASPNTLLFCPNLTDSSTFVSHDSFNSTNNTLHQEQSRHHQFALPHHHQQQHRLSLLPSNAIFHPTTAKRTIENGGDVGNYPTFSPCSGEILLSSLPTGVSPRLKARRYSYPHELIGNNYTSSSSGPYTVAPSSNKDYSPLSTSGSTPVSSLPPSSISDMDHANNIRDLYHANLDRSTTPHHLSSLASEPPCSSILLDMNGLQQQKQYPQSVCSSSGTVITEELLLPLPLQQHAQQHQACSSSTSSAATAGDVPIGMDQQLVVPPDLMMMDVQLPGFNSPESAFYQYQNRMEGQRCQVCGEPAAGFHHGAYVCEACKKFFMRHSLTDTKPTNVCPTGGNCVVVKGSRGKCQICRFRKCLYVGMKMKDPESQSDIDISTIPCRVCGGRSSGFHFGALTCEGCKGFFRRTESSACSLVCVGGQNACTITPRSRNACKSCRFRRCLAAGMSKKGSRIGRQPNAVKFHCAIEIQQLRSLQSTFANDVHLGRICSASTPLTNNNNTYGPAFALDMAEASSCITTTKRMDMESPKYDPDTLIPIGHRLEWVGDGEHKPPLSLLLLLPPSNSDPINTTTGGILGSINDGSAALHPSSSSIPISRYGGDRAPLLQLSSSRSSSNLLLRMDGGGSGDVEHQLVRSEQRSTSDEDDVQISPIDTRLPHQSFPTRITTNANASNLGRGHVSLAIRSLLSPPDELLSDNNNHDSTNRRPTNRHSAQTGTTPPPVMTNGQTTNLTTALIANLAKQLADAEDAEAEEAIDGIVPTLHSDINHVDPSVGEGFHNSTAPPPQEVILRFIDGMRTATEFLRLPNTYFKSRFSMSSIPLDQQDNTLHVWSHMMNHFHMHAQQIVQFAKLVPGFNNLGITARSNLVRGAMYPVVLLLLSRDYQPDTDEYNYFDFTVDERSIILRHFPSFVRITEHLRMAGRLLHHLGLSLPELSLSSAVEILRNYQLLEEPACSNAKELFLLAHHSLRTCMTRRSDLARETDERHRWAQLCALSKMIQAMNREHHEILSGLKELRPDLHFPELYVEMFQLADRASELFSVSDKAVTLTCSTAFHQQQHHSSDTPLSLCPPPSSMSESKMPLQYSQVYSNPQQRQPDQSHVDEADDNNSLILTTSNSVLSTVDRWDAGRFALAVPAVAALSAIAEASQQQQHPFGCPTTVPQSLYTMETLNPTLPNTTTSYFPATAPQNAVISSTSSTFYFPSTQHHPPQSQL